MIPLYDINRRQSFPFVTLLLIVANVLVFFFQLSLGPEVGQRFVFLYGMIPARVEIALAGGAVTLAQAATPLLTSIFLHGGFMHLLGNMWFLWVFGDNVEDRIGRARYLAFYLLTGVGAGIAHVLFNWGSPIPAVGARGAISGVLGAYAVLFPGSRVVTLVPLVVFYFLARVPAVVMIGYWFVIQFLSGVYSLAGPQSGGVAWWAHIGGFVLGLALVLVLRKPKRPPVVYYMN